MREFRDGDRRHGPQPPTGRTDGSPDRLREIGQLHFHAASYASAVDYLTAALELGRRDNERDAGEEFETRLQIADCRRMQGLFPEAAAELEQCMALAVEDPVRRARCQVAVARVRQAQGDHATALEAAREGFSQLSLSDHHREVGAAQIVMGICHASMGQPRKADEFFNDALATYRRIGDTVSQAHVLNNLAILAKGQARWARALQLYERAESLLDKTGATYETIALLLNKAILFRKMGRRAEALASAVRGNRGARSRGDQAYVARFCLLLGQLYTEDARYAEAEQSLLEARVTAERQGMGRELALCDEFLGDLMRALGRFEEAESNYALAESRALEISPVNDVLVEVRRRRAELAIEQGLIEAAVEYADSGLEMAERCGEEFERGFLQRARGSALMLRGDTKAGLASLESAAEAFRQLKLGPQLADTLMELATAHTAADGAGVSGFLRARANLREAVALDDEAGRIDHCTIQLTLARTEMSLGNHDEALLCLFEVERIGCAHDPEVVAAADALRMDIERSMTSSAREFLPDLSLLAGLPEMVDDDDFVQGDALGRVLEAACRRLRAERGFVALRRGFGRGRLDVLAVQGINRAVARTLGQRALALNAERGSEVRVWSQAGSGGDWAAEVAAGKGPMDSVLAFRVIDTDESVECMVYFDAASEGGSAIFDAESIAVASTLVGMLRGAMFREARPSVGAVGDSTSAGPFANIITQSDRVMQVLELCSKVAQSPYTVLFEGETGTGKGLLARLIHELSERREHPLIVVNCAAIPETLLESELFGHVKGAFTGADRAKPGLIMAANRGTLFLDEVGKMPLPMQAKLLQFLDELKIRPVGGTESLAVDVRVICASKRDLEDMVQREEFLEDLYYRLLDFPIQVPPLRERGADIGLLADVFIERAAARLGREPQRLTRSAAALLDGYSWPGNVRELEKVITRAVLMASDDDRIRNRHLSETLHRGDGGARALQGDGQRPLREQIAELEREAVRAALESTGWNRSAAARQLQISYPTLLQKIRSFNLKES